MGSCLCMYTWRLHIVSWSKKLYLVTFRSRLGLYHSRLGLLLTLTLFENWQIIATLLPKTKSYTEIYILKIGLISQTSVVSGLVDLEVVENPLTTHYIVVVS